MKPSQIEDKNGLVIRSGIHTYGDTVHVFVERKNYNGIFLPGFEKWESHYNPEPVGLKCIIPTILTSVHQYFWTRVGFKFQSFLAIPVAVTSCIQRIEFKYYEYYFTSKDC